MVASGDEVQAQRQSEPFTALSRPKSCYRQRVLYARRTLRSDLVFAGPRDMTTQTERQRIADLLFYAAVLLLTYLAYRLFEPFLVPLCWAAVFAVCFYPMHARFEKRWTPTMAAALSTAIVTLVLIVPALLISTAFFQEAATAVTDLVGAVESGRFARLEQTGRWIETNILGRPPTDLTTYLREIATRVSGTIAEQATAVVKNLALFLVSFIAMLFAVFFFFRDARAIVDTIRRLLPFEEERREQILEQAHDLIFATIVSGLIVAAVQGLLGGVAFAVLGLGEPVFWGVMMAFFSLLPIMGAWVIWAPAAIWLGLTGHLTQAVILAGIGAGVVGLVDNFLRPALLAGRAELNGLLIFVGLLGGVTVFGLLGLVLGPVVLATVAILFDAYTLPRRKPRHS
jgi:predicted PurR-regulated permease PerM